ncbi:hypothetical protein ABIC65_003161 [Sphingomonas trueperi]|jgi:hypothetical protein|uniref:hypothetical protein n=1 Tax=Sphingomonas trueperi TaxID=53317 RepID=UPI003392C8D9
MPLYLDCGQAMRRDTAREFVAEHTPVRRLRPSEFSFDDIAYDRSPQILAISRTLASAADPVG